MEKKTIKFIFKQDENLESLDYEIDNISYDISIGYTKSTNLSRKPEFRITSSLVKLNDIWEKIEKLNFEKIATIEVYKDAEKKMSFDFNFLSASYSITVDDEVQEEIVLI